MTTLKDIIRDLVFEIDENSTGHIDDGISRKEWLDEKVEEYIELIKTRLIG